MRIKKLAAAFLFFGLLGSITPAPRSWAQVKAPDFSGTDLTGVRHSLADYQGKMLVLYFWAVWCPACVQDTGNIKSLYENYSAKGVGFLTVSLDGDKNRLERFVKSRNVPYPVLYDHAGTRNPIANAYRIQGTPTFFIISPDGFVLTGGYWSDQLADALKQLV